MAIDGFSIALWSLTLTSVDAGQATRRILSISRHYDSSCVCTSKYQCGVNLCALKTIFIKIVWVTLEIVVIETVGLATESLMGKSESFAGPQVVAAKISLRRCCFKLLVEHALHCIVLCCAVFFSFFILEEQSFHSETAVSTAWCYFIAFIVSHCPPLMGWLIVQLRLKWKVNRKKKMNR